MSEDTSSTQLDYVEISAGLVSAYVSNNSVRAADLPELIRTVHSTLAALKSGAGQGGENQTEKPTPAQIKKSITPEALISFEDGQALQDAEAAPGEPWPHSRGIPREVRPCG
jgi:predicted transcriptional regulator